MKPLYPLFLRLEGRRVLVVGAGTVGTRKIDELIEAGARVCVVARDASSEVEALFANRVVDLQRRSFVASDVDGAWLVVAATNAREVNREIASACEARNVFVNAVDDPDHASAYFASVVRRPPFTIAISSNGELPALSKLLRQVIEAVLPEERFIERARALRAKWKKDGTPMSSRFAELVRELTKS